MADFNAGNIVSGISELVKNLAGSIPDITQIIAFDAQEKIRNRIQEEGVDADGKRLPGYSVKELPSFFFTGKANKKLKKDEFGETALEQNDFLSYKTWRELNGLQTDHVDLTFTGGMFRRMGILSEGQQGDKYVVTVGGKDNDSQDKIDWNSDRYGDIMRLSKEEEAELEQTYNDEIQKVINEAGFGA